MVPRRSVEGALVQPIRKAAKMLARCEPRTCRFSQKTSDQRFSERILLPKKASQKIAEMA